MRIKINNRLEEVKRECLSVSELLEAKNFTFRMLVVKINGKLIRKEDYSRAMVEDGDDVTVLHLISGG